MKYQQSETLLHRIDPRIKLLYSLGVSILIVAVSSPFWLAILTMAVIGVFSLIRINFSQIRVFVSIVCVIVVSTVMSQSFFYYFEPRTALVTLVPARVPVIGTFTGGIAVYREGIVYGLVQSMRIICATFLGATIVMSTHPSAFIRSLRQMHLPHDVVFVILVCIRFLPHMLEEAKRIVLAMKLRGLRSRGVGATVRAVRYGMVPLIINSLRQARTVAIAAEVRGFSPAASKRRRWRPVFSTVELMNIAFFIVLLYAAILPYKMGFSKVPFVHTFFYSIPFTAVLFVGIRMVPKPGAATFIICGHSLFVQLISRGINPLWWPYALSEALALELYFWLVKDYAKGSVASFVGGAIRGLVVYLYFYYISAPLFWHKCYASWYIALHTGQGTIGSAVGGWLGCHIGRVVERACRHGGL